MNINCFHYEEPDKEGFTPETQIFVNRILKENNTSTYEVKIHTYTAESGLGGPDGYSLAITVNNKVVLTNTLDSLSLHGKYHVSTSGYGNDRGFIDVPFMGLQVRCDTLDSIQIITGSVIKAPGLGLGGCNLTHLPSEIGKLRVQSLNIGENYPSLKSLPDELMQLSEPPKYWDTLIVNYDMGAVNVMPGVSDTLKQWLLKHAAQK